MQMSSSGLNCSLLRCTSGHVRQARKYDCYEGLVFGESWALFAQSFKCFFSSLGDDERRLFQFDQIIEFADVLCCIVLYVLDVDIVNHRGPRWITINVQHLGSDEELMSSNWVLMLGVIHASWQIIE